MGLTRASFGKVKPDITGLEQEGFGKGTALAVPPQSVTNAALAAEGRYL